MIFIHMGTNDKLRARIKQVLNESVKYFNDKDYERYINNAKDSLEKVKRIEKITSGVTRRGDKYIIIRYIPKLNPREFEGGEFTRSVKVFYKDYDHLESIMNELNLSINDIDS